MRVLKVKNKTFTVECNLLQLLVAPVNMCTLPKKVSPLSRFEATGGGQQTSIVAADNKHKLDP